jgi:hypothetical protein
MSIQAGFLGHTPFLLFSPPPTGGFRGQLGCTSHTGFLFKKKNENTASGQSDDFLLPWLSKSLHMAACESREGGGLNWEQTHCYLWVGDLLTMTPATDGGAGRSYPEN